MHDPGMQWNWLFSLMEVYVHIVWRQLGGHLSLYAQMAWWYPFMYTPFVLKEEPSMTRGTICVNMYTDYLCILSWSGGTINSYTDGPPRTTIREDRFLPDTPKIECYLQTVCMIVMIISIYYYFSYSVQIIQTLYNHRYSYYTRQETGLETACTFTN